MTGDANREFAFDMMGRFNRLLKSGPEVEPALREMLRQQVQVPLRVAQHGTLLPRAHEGGVLTLDLLGLVAGLRDPGGSAYSLGAVAGSDGQLSGFGVVHPRGMR